MRMSNSSDSPLPSSYLPSTAVVGAVRQKKIQHKKDKGSKLYDYQALQNEVVAY